MKTLRQHRTFLGWLMTGLMAVWLPGPVALGATGTWILDNNGNWTGTPANWQGGTIPNATGDTAIFRNNVTGNRTITLNSAITLGNLQVGDSLGANTFTFAGTNALTLDNSSGNALVNKFNSTTDVWQAPLVLTDSVNWNIFSGILQVNGAANAQVSYTGAGDTTKNGAGALQLNRTGTYTGNWLVNLGTLNIGGANSATPASLGTGTGGITLNGTGSQNLAVFSLNNNGTASDTTVTYSGNNDVILQGGAAINVDRNFVGGANDRVTHILDNLTFNGGILRVTSANGHSLRFDGTTTLVGDTTVFEPLGNTVATRSNLILAGPITDGAATRSVIKEGAGRMLIQSIANTYDGITSIKDGVLELASGANLGSGATFVAGGVLSVADTATVTNIAAAGGLKLVGQLGTSRFALPVLAYNGTAAIDSGNPLAVDVPVSGMILGIDGVSGAASINTANIDLAQVGSGSNRVWVSNVLGFDRTYRGTLTNGASGDLRLLSPTNNLILDTNANILGGAGATNNLVFGYDYGNAILLTGNNTQNINAATSGGTFSGGGTVSVRVDNANTLGTVTVNRGVTLNINGTGLTTPVGAGVVTALGGTISTDNATTAKFGNTDFRLYGGSTLLLDNGGVAAANTDRRLLSSTNLDLISSTVRLIGDGGASANNSSQTVASIDYWGGSTISVDRDGATGSVTTLTTGSLNRNSGGALQLRNISNTATTFGTATGTQKLIITSAPTITNGMIGANIALWGGANATDSAQPLFVTYDATHGVQAAAFGVTATNVTTLQGATAGQIVDLNAVAGTTTMTANATMQALRLRTTANTQVLANGGFTITLGSTAGAGQGAGLFLAHTAGNGVTHSANFNFGTQEGLVYVATPATNGVVGLSGVLSGSGGLTRFGDGILSLSGANTFTGAITLNSGETRISQGAFGSAAAVAGTIAPAAARNVDVWGGSFFLQSGSARYNNDVTIRNDARFGNVNVGSSAFNNMTIAARSGSTAPIVAWIQNQAGGNYTTGYGNMTINGPVQFSVVHALQINGTVTGSAVIDKFMNERLQFHGDSAATLTSPINVYAGTLLGLNAGATAKPFGTGAVTIQPGSSLVVASAGNLGTSQLTMNSDLGGISGLAMTYTGDPAAIAGGTSTVNSTAPWKGFLGIGGPAFDYDLDQSAAGLWGGGAYLGAPLGVTGTYTGSLTPTAANQFLLGTGQGAVRIAKPLTGSNAAVVGISMTGLGRADQVVNNSGGAVNYDVPMTYTGTTTIHPNMNLRLAADNALDATGGIILNGGTLRGDTNVGQLRFLAPISISNAITLIADSNIAIDDNATDLRLTGNISLAPGSTGVVRTLSVNVGQPGGAANNAGLLYLDGGVSDGAGGSGNHFVKGGPGVAMLTGPMTYTGTTTIAGGLLGINGDADLASSSQILGLNGGLAIWENSFTTTRNYSAHGGALFLDVAGGLTLTQGAVSTIDGNNSIVKRGLGTLVLNGTNAVSGLFFGDGVLQFNSQDSIGDMAATSGTGFSIGGDVLTGGAGSNTRYTGGTARFNFTGASNRGVAFNNNGNTNFAGGLDVTAGNTFTIGGVISQGTELDFGFKTGTGTLITTGANTWRQLAVVDGTLQFANNTPWANSTATASENTVVEMIGGTIRGVNTGANIALANAASTTTYNYGGGTHLRLASGTGFSAELAADNLLRQNQGTLVIETEGATLLGGAGATNAARVIVTNAVNASVARASALTNGIFAPHVIGADSTGVGNFLQNDATTGFVAYSGATNTSLLGLAPTAIGNISSSQSLTGTNSIYAFRTTADVSGGTLVISAIDNLRQGGILINGSNTISSNLIFNPASATAAGTGTLAEGLVYVKTGETATISGNVTANAFTKFGKGTLVLSGSNTVTGDVSVQEGTLRLNGGSPFSRMNSELNINAGASLDLNGNSVSVETIGGNNRTIATAPVGGSITNTGAASTLAVASPVASSYTGTLNGSLKVLKAGAGALTIQGFSASAPDSGNNTYTGGTDIYGVGTTGGITLNNTTFGLGGFGTTTQPVVNLYSGTLGLLFSNGTTGVNGTNGQQFSNVAVRFGADDGVGMTLNVRGPAQINVNQATPSNNTAFGQGNLMQVGNLNMSNNTLQLSGGNLYRLKVAGTTTIQGAQATFQTNSDSTAIQLDGLVTGSGAINKTGDGTLRTLIFTNTGNNFSGGLNIQAGDVQNTNPSTNTLGTGAVRVFPEGTLRIAGNGGVNGANLQVFSRVNSLGAVVLDDNFNPTVLTSSNFISVYNTTLQLAQPYFTQALDLSTIGDGRTFLGSGINTEVKYMAATLGAGAVDAWNPGVGVYRLVGGVNNFAFDGVDNVLTGGNYVQVGPQRNNVLGATGNTGNTVIIRNSNNVSGGMQITEGTAVAVEVGGSPVGETPLGSGAVEVYGSLTFQGSLGSNWNAGTSAASTPNINLRPGGTVRLIDGNIYGSGGNLVAGGQGRWGDAVGIDLNGGTFRYDGAANFNSVETIGDVTVRKGGALLVARTTTASSAQLNVGNLDRIDRGTLTVSYGTVGFLGTNLTTPMSYDRLTATQVDGTAIASALAGTTTNGAGVVNGGMLAPWIIDATGNTFLGYNPTGTGTGFQALVSTATPGAGEISYNQILSGATIGALASTDIVDVTTAAKTLGANTSLHALRLNQNISPTATFNTLTVVSGGILNTGTPTINPTGAVTAGVVSPMTINFGTGGAGEAIFYNAGNMIVQAQMVAALGLTKFGGSTLTINSINPGIDGAVTINAGAVVARVPFSGTGTPLGAGNGVFGGQDVILNGGTLQLDPFMANAGGTASEIASNVRATAIFDSHIRVRGDAGLNNNAQANYVRISDLTFENAGGATAMDGNGVITLALQSGVWVNGTTTLIPQAAFNMTSNSGVMATFAGQVTGTADLEKFGNGTMNLINASNNYSGGTTIWGTTAATRASTVASGVRGAGTPFGTGAITVNPGAVVRISDNLNIASNAVTLKSDGIGLASLGIAHNGALPTITTGAAVAGSVRVESTGPFAGVLSLDYGYYSQALNMSTLAGGNWWLGNSTQGEAFYFNNTLGAASNGKYLIGGGGDQSGINFGSVLVSGVRTSLFENVFTGGTANTTRVEVGALTADLFANGPSFVNGNSGFQVMATRNTGLLGDVRVNTNTTLAIGNNFALGNGRLVLNGGALRYDLGQNNYATANITLDNNVLIQGDWSTNSGGELVLNGNVAMHDGTAGATRTWSLTGSGAMAVGLTAGSATNGVISGNAGSNLIKNGAQQVSFRGANTYEGYTQIGQSTIVIAGDVLSGVAGPLGNSDSPIILASGAANVGGGISVGGKYTIGRDIVVSQATGTGFSVIEARTNETAVINGGISIITGANVNLGGLGSNNGTGAGGVLVINGPISGAGAVTFGTGAAAPNANGPVSLAGNSNGYSINTYSGGSTFNNTRVEITGDTLFNGPVTAPTIISGPFGTGAMTWTSGETGNGAAFLAVGGPRTIVNAFNATSSAANATYKFMGNQALTFTRNWDINSDSAAVRNRTFQVNNPYQPTTFSGNLSNSATTGSNFIKTGSGLLILTGTNTQANLLTSDAANYGTGVFIDDGILRVNSDAALGNSTTLAAAGPHIAGPADVQLRGGYLSVSSGFTTARQIVLTSSAGGIDVASGQTLTLSTPTRGAFGIRKVGTGTLALNSNANTLNALTLGGGQQLGNVGFFSHTGGVVSTTATSGTPFVTAAATETVTVNSGAISLVGGAVAQAISVPRFIYGAAGGVMLNKGATTSTLTASEAAATAFQRGAAFNSVSYGTLTIRPSVLANLGTGGEQFLITNAGARPANTALTGGDILTVPSVFVALPGAGQDANFARYDATNGFMQHAVTTVSTLGTTAASNVAAITVADTVGAATNDIIDIAALNLAANATSFDGTQTLRINRGGLIFNGATAPTLAVNTLFGTGTGASLTEAIVYVRDGQTGTSTISGNVTARDFTKTGPGLLELSGATNALNTNALRLPVLSVQDGTFRFASSGAQFSNANRPAGINTTLGSYVLNVNEAGIFDMNGQSTSLGGLAGNGTVTSGSAGAVTLTARNGFGVDTTFSGSIGNGSGTVGLTKTGNGILTLNGVGSYTGGTTVQAGRVTNATGVAAVAGGRLEAQTVLALGTGPITLAGGDLRFNGATLLDGGQTTSESSDGVDGLLYGGPNGYDITVAATSVSQGTALPSNTTSVLRAATQNALVNSLTVNAPQLNVTEGIVLVKGASTFSQSNTVLRTVGRLFLQGQINAAGSTITKIGYGGTAGVGELVVTNTESGLAQNNVGLWKVYGGLLNARSADGASNPLGSAPVVELNGGSTNYGLLLNSDGDGTAAAERITTYANTTIRFGSALPVSSAAFVSSGASRLGTDRVIGNNDDKTIVVGNLEVRGALGSAFSYFINANNTSIWVDGTTNFQRDWTFQADGTATTFNGVISGSGTLNRKSNGANVFFNAVNTYDGGSFFTGGGRNLFGSFEGNQVTLSNTAKLGTGHVYVGSLAFLQINDAGNLRSDQNINVAGNLSWASTFSLAADLTLDQVRLRSYGLGGIQNNPTDYYLSASNPSAAVLALGTVYNQALNQRSLGDGMWFIGSATNMVGANGSYDAATLAPGRGNNYRLGAGGSTLFMGSNGNANVLTNTDATALANLIVGAPMTVQNAAAWSGGTGTLVLLQNQNYTGSTLVNRGSTLDFRGTLTTSGIETYGILNVAGEAGTFRSGGAGSNIPVTLRPGSTLRFDNTSAGVLPTTATQGRWEDSAGITLNDAAVRLQGNAAVEVAETVGVITAANGANRIEIVRGVQGRGTELRANSIARSNFGTVQFNTNSEQLGTDERLIITGTAPTVTNGMVAPWMITNTNFEFLTYNADTGFVKAGFTRNQAAAAPLAATVSAPTDRTIFSGAVVLNAGVDFETYALRLDGNVTLGTGNDTTAQLVIGSGGLLSNGTRAITSGIVAGSIGSPAELILFNNGTTTIGDATAANFSTSGQIVATGITKAGAGNLQFVSNNAAFNGDIRLQQGTVELNYTQTSAANPTSVTIGGNGGNIVFQGAGTVLNLRGGNDTFTGNNLTFAKGLVLGDFVPTVTVSIDRAGGTITDKVMVFPTLTFGASNGDVGQIFRVDGRNGFDLAISGTTTLNGRSAFAIENAYTGSASDMFLDGLVTGTGTLIKGPSDGKNREMTLRNVSSLNTYTDGTVLQGGTLRVFAKAPNVATNATTDLTFGGLGSGTITLMQGTLDLRVDNEIGGAPDTNLERVIFGDTVAPNVILNGSTTINVDRTGLVASGTTKQIVLGNLTMGQQQLTVSGGNAYGIEFGGTTSLLGSPFINNTTEVVLNGAISTDGGGAVIINKTNTGTLWINSANPTLAASTYVNAGLLAFGNRLTGSTTANLGAGDIFVNPGAAIQVRGTGNINTGAGQQVNLVGTAYAPSVFRTTFAATQANLTSMIQSRTATSNEITYLAWEANPAAENYNQSTIGDGRIYFGAIAGDRTYTGAAAGSALTPGLSNLANSVMGGTSTNRVYRLGGGDTNARTTVINLTAAGAGLNDVGGATDVQVGSQALLGPNGNYSVGFVLFQDQNTYTGQTVVARNNTLRFSTAMNAGNTAGPLGGNASALVDIYGGLRIEQGGSMLNAAGTANAYTNVNLRPTSNLIFLDMTATGVNSNRWHDSAAVNLDGAAITADAANNADNNTETVGSVIFDRGSRVYLTNEGTGDAFLTAASVTRATASAGAGTGRGTLVFTPTATATFGAAATAGVAQSQFRSTAAITPSTTSAVSGMLPGYYMESNGNRFVKNGANGVTPVVDGDMVAMPTGAGAGNEVVNITATTSMGSFETSIFALRGGAFTLNSPTGANNDATITLTGSGADVGGVASAGAFVINPNLKFGASGTNEALFYTGSTLTVNGFITAGSITKFGTGGTLVIANDQSDAARGTGNGYQGGWVVNEGALQFGQFGSAGNAHSNNTIVLNGSQAGSAQLNLRAQPADTLLNYTYTSGKIFAVDFATIDWDAGASDRVHSISDIEIQQSGGIGNAAANGTLDAYLRVAIGNNRSILSAGSLTVASNAILNVDATAAAANFTAFASNAAYLSNGISSGLSVASLSGSNRLTKWGDGTLYVRGNSSGFSGPLVIDQGSVFVTNNGSLGTGAVTVNRYGVLEVGVAGFAPTNSSVTYNEGSIERWSIDGARSGAVNLGKATLQVAANQINTSATVTLNGGGVQAYNNGDNHSGAQTAGGVLRILPSTVNFTLTADSFLGDRYFEGANGLDSGKQVNDNRPMEEYASGSILEIKGVISGSAGVTKVGYDTVILSGANTYTGATVVTGGRLQLGVDDALPTTGTVTTTANGVLDLNGQNQTVGTLNNVVATTSAGSTSGFITNSGTTVKTLTVGNGVSTNFAYAGVIQHNVALTKTGTATMTLHNANTYTGNTVITGGTLALGANGSVSDSPWVNVQGAASVLDVARGGAGYTFDGKISGGGLDGVGTTYATVANAAKINGNLTLGDHIAEVQGQGTMAPGASSNLANITTAGDALGHIYTNGNLTINGPLVGTASTAIDRLALQITTATVNASTLGAFDYTSTWLTTNAANYLTSTTGNGSLAGHDYINVGGVLTLNQYGRVAVTNLGAGTYAGGDVFNLLDWTSLTNNGFTVNGTQYDGSGDTAFDLDLPTLSAGLLWDTSLFISHGVVFVVPEPSRAMLLLFGLLGLMMRRRRQTI